LKSDIGNILRERIGKDMEDLIRWAQRVEWDNIIVANLEKTRKKDQVYDAKMAFLVYYNEEIDEEERERRWDTLDRDAADRVIDAGNILLDTPWPDSWHDGDIHYTQEEWDSTVENFPKARAAIHQFLQGEKEISLSSLLGSAKGRVAKQSRERVDRLQKEERGTWRKFAPHGQGGERHPKRYQADR
jgi:hypothetical protein